MSESQIIAALLDKMLDDIRRGIEVKMGPVSNLLNDLRVERASLQAEVERERNAFMNAMATLRRTDAEVERLRGIVKGFLVIADDFDLSGDIIESGREAVRE